MVYKLYFSIETSKELCICKQKTFLKTYICGEDGYYYFIFDYLFFHYTDLRY